MNVKQMTNTMLKQKAESFGQMLYHCAKAQPKRKFHALYDKIYRPDILKTAWLKVKANKGSAGVDRLTFDYIQDEIGENNFLNSLYLKLKNQTYQPQPVKRVWIPKGNSKDMRPLGIPTIEDRVVQQATKMVIEPIFETMFKDSSYGFRPNRNAHQAMKAIRKASQKSYWVVDIDIKGYFDNIHHDKLMKLVKQRVSDRRVLKLIRQWLKVGVLDEKELKPSFLGSPQGGVISPLLANIYLNYLDTIWEKRYASLGTLVRYADDMVILCHTKKDAIQSIQILKAVFQKLELEMNLDKSRLVNIWDDKGGFDFLGFHNRKFPKRKKNGQVMYFLEHIPKKGAMKKMRQTFKDYISPRSKLVCNTMDLIDGINRKVVGMRNYYRISPIATRWLNQIDWYILELLTLHYNKRRNNKNKRSNLSIVREMTKYRLKKLSVV